MIANANSASNIYTRMDMYNRHVLPAGIWFDNTTGVTSFLLNQPRFGIKGELSMLVFH